MTSDRRFRSIAAGAIGLACILQIAPLAAADPVRDQRIAELIEDLADDDIRFNARTALIELHSIAEPAIPQLELALHSDDWQQRQLAASVLHRLTPDDPTLRLLEVTVEGFRQDRLPFGREDDGTVAYTYCFNAASGIRFITRHAGRAEPFLEAGLQSSDSQQEFLCAIALGFGGQSQHAEKCAQVLIPHLRDNDIRGDALLAASALYGIGPSVIPHLRNAALGADVQQAQLLTLIELDITDPPRTKSQRIQRSRHNSIASMYHDPVVEFSPFHLGIYWPDGTFDPEQRAIHHGADR